MIPLTLPGKFPLLDFTQSTNDYGYPDSAYLNVTVAANAVGSSAVPSLTHIPESGHPRTDDLSSRIYTVLKEKAGGSTEFVKLIEGDGVPVAIITHTGPHTLYFNKNTQINIEIDNFDSMQPSKDNGISEWKSPDDGRTYRSIVEIDEGTNSLNGRISVNASLADLSHADLVEMILFHLATSLEDGNQVKQRFTSSVQQFTFFAITNTPNPAFIFGNPPGQ